MQSQTGTERRTPRPPDGAALGTRQLVGESGRLYRAALAMCGCPHDAEDLVQETFARVLARPRVLRGGNHVPYLMGAVRNTYLMQRRAEARRPRAVTLTEETSSAAPDDAVERIVVREALATLPAELCRVLVAVDVAGLSYREAARELGLPAGTVMSRLHRARQRLISRFEADGTRPAVAAA